MLLISAGVAMSLMFIYVLIIPFGPKTQGVESSVSMSESSDQKIDTCFLANASLVLLLSAVLLFVYALSDLGDNLHCWIGGGLVYLGFPLAIFSLIRIKQNKGKLRGKKRAWTAVILGLVLAILCLLGALIYATNFSFSDGGC